MKSTMIPRAVVVLAVAALAGACAPAIEAPVGPGAGVAPVQITAEMVDQGRTLFTGAGRCGVCHGPQGRGGSLGPNLTDAQWIWVEPGSPNMHAQIYGIIRDGIENPRQYPAPMPAQGGGSLTVDQMNALSAYVMSISNSL
jgi:mono/diheme cytochrome c family protein